jgi:hypothetical protein
MHRSPPPAHASFRLITALRLYHSFTAGAGAGSEEELTAPSRRWRDTILGHEELVSEENEKACKESVGDICAVVIDGAERGIKAVQEEMKLAREEWYRNVLVTVELLWLEGFSVCKAMLIV